MVFTECLNVFLFVRSQVFFKNSPYDFSVMFIRALICKPIGDRPLWVSEEIIRQEKVNDYGGSRGLKRPQTILLFDSKFVRGLFVSKGFYFLDKSGFLDITAYMINGDIGEAVSFCFGQFAVGNIHNFFQKFRSHFLEGFLSFDNVA